MVKETLVMFLARNSDAEDVCKAFMVCMGMLLLALTLLLLALLLLAGDRLEGDPELFSAELKTFIGRIPWLEEFFFLILVVSALKAMSCW